MEKAQLLTQLTSDQIEFINNILPTKTSIPNIPWNKTIFKLKMLKDGNYSLEKMSVNPAYLVLDKHLEFDTIISAIETAAALSFKDTLVIYDNLIKLYMPKELVNTSTIDNNISLRPELEMELEKDFEITNDEISEDVKSYIDIMSIPAGSINSYEEIYAILNKIHKRDMEILIGSRISYFLFDKIPGYTITEKITYLLTNNISQIIETDSSSKNILPREVLVDEVKTQNVLILKKVLGQTLYLLQNGRPLKCNIKAITLETNSGPIQIDINSNNIFDTKEELLKKISDLLD